MYIYRIGDACNLLTFQQCTGLGLRLQPTATGHKIDGLCFEHLRFLLPDSAGEVMGRTISWQKPTVMTMGGEVPAT